MAGCKGKSGREFTLTNIKHRTEYRDSLYIVHTLQWWGRSGWYKFNDYSKMYDITNQQVKYFVSATFYNAQRTKLVTWTGEKFPNARTLIPYSKDDADNRICPNGADTMYSMIALIGFRVSPDSMWSLYPFDLQTVGCSSTQEGAEQIFSRYYFNNMKEHSQFRIQQEGERRGFKEGQPIGYNIQDGEFWDKCWLWEKDTIGSNSLYVFQIYGYHDMGKRANKESATPFEPPHIDYPMTITRLYRKP